VTDAEVDAALEDRKKESGPVAANIDEVVKGGGSRLEALKRSVRYQLAIDKLLTKDVKVEEAALKTWFDKNKATYGSPARVKLGVITTSTKPRADTMAQQLKAKTKTFAQLVEEQKKAKDPAATQSTAETPEFLPLESLPPSVKATVNKLKAGETSGVINLAPEPQKLYAILRVVTKEDAKNPSLTDIRTRVEHDYKLEQAARKSVTASGQKYDDVVKQVEQGIMQQNMQQGNMTPPSRSDVLRMINQTEVQKLTARLQQSAKVEISEPMFAKIADTYKPAPAAPGAPGAPAAGGAPATSGAPAAPSAPAAPAKP
jgi:hypothetical protein